MRIHLRQEKVKAPDINPGPFDMRVEQVISSMVRKTRIHPEPARPELCRTGRRVHILSLSKGRTRATPAGSTQQPTNALAVSTGRGSIHAHFPGMPRHPPTSLQPSHRYPGANLQPARALCGREQSRETDWAMMPLVSRNLSYRGLVYGFSTNGR